jgi:hypothetical protein
MSLAYLHGEQYIVPVLLLFAAVFIGVPAIIGWAYYRWRGRKKRANTKSRPDAHAVKK